MLARSAHTARSLLNRATHSLSLPITRAQHTRTPAAQAQTAARSSSSIVSSAAASSSSSSSSRSRLLLLVGSSLLVGELVRSSLADEQRCEAASAPHHVVDAADIYNPPPPPHDRWYEDWDGLENIPPSVDPATGRPLLVTRHLLFVRHGQYVLQTDETRDQDPVLTERGREQARITGARLASLGYPISTIHVSSMARAKETAAIISESFPGVAVQETGLLSEGVPCAHVPLHPTWRPSPEDVATEPPRIKRAFENLVQRWREVDGVQVHSVEEWKEANAKLERKRLAAGNGTVATGQVKESSDGEGDNFRSSARGTITLADDDTNKASAKSLLPPLHVDRYELVVCHGNVIRYSLLRALQLPVQAWLRFAIWNCGISHLIIRTNGHVGLQTLGDTGHLSKDMITYH